MSVTFGLAHVDTAARCVTLVASDLDVNVGNRNACLILERLGYDPMTLDGEADGAEFLGRVLVANVGRDDSGDPAVPSAGDLAGRFMEGGLRPGYFDSTMAALAALATEAQARGLSVGWG